MLEWMIQKKKKEKAVELTFQLITNEFICTCLRSSAGHTARF